MRTTKFFIGALTAMTILSACDQSGTDQLIDLTLDKTTATVAIDSTVTLTPTLNPATSKATVTWESSNTAVATVAAGVVTGVAEGTAMIAASAEGKTATCLITVVKGTQGGGGWDDKDPASLKGTEYYPIIMDGTTSTKLGSKIITDFRPDDTSKFLYIWEATYTGGTATGLNFYGNADGYTTLTVTSLGWSGMGFNVPNGPVAELYQKIAKNPESYYFHMAIKSTDNYAHCFYLFGVESAGSKFVLGTKSVYDGPVMKDFTRDGTWQEIEIPMSQMITALAGYNALAADVNLLVALTEGTAGAVLNLDAVFIYKK